MKIIRIFLSFLLLTLSVYAHAGQVDINSADAPTLAKNIKGIGLKKAKLIVEYRTKHGAFKNISELTKVKGIGKKLIDKNRETLVVKALVVKTVKTTTK